MPSASAYPTPGPGRRGAVIHHLAHRRARNTAPTAPVRDANDPHVQLAETLEAHFLSRGQTLSNEETAEAFTNTLDAVAMMLDGALANRVVEEPAHAVLRGMLDGMRGTPQHV